MLRRLPPLLLAAGVLGALSACGSPGAPYAAPGDRPPATGPPITLPEAQGAIESHGVDLFQNRVSQGQGDLDPRPVESGGFTTADSGYVDLYVFVDRRTARAALPSARAAAPEGRVFQAGNVVGAVPQGRGTPMVDAVPRALRQLAAQPPRTPGRATPTPLQSNEGGASQPQGTP